MSGNRASSILIPTVSDSCIREKSVVQVPSFSIYKKLKCRTWSSTKLQSDGGVTVSRIDNKLVRVDSSSTHQPITRRRMKKHASHVGTFRQQPRNELVPGRELVPAQARALIRSQRVCRVPNILKRHRSQRRDADAQNVFNFEERFLSWKSEIKFEQKYF